MTARFPSNYSCSCCDSLIHEDDAYHLDGYDYCSDCYHDEVDKNRSIHDYGYKPEPIFYGDSHRYFGVELEIDGAGKDSDNADEILAIANKDEEHIYIKGDGSLDDGMELVTHPMSLDYHKQFSWEEIMKKAIYLGYRSHQTSTYGLHVHDGKVAIYKRPKAAHKIHFNAPDSTKAIMGHTRFATHGDKKKNYNNHPFAGHADK